MIVLSRDDVRSVLDLDRLVDALADAMTDLSAGRTSMPPRGSVMVPERHGMLFAMSAFLPSSGVLATKLVSLFPLNTDRPTHQAVICCFDPADGRPLALMDGTYITAIRTAAGSALATRLLARRSARIACVIGTGVQAHAHVTLLARQPGLDRIRVAGRDAAKVARLVDEFAELGLPVEAAPSIEEGVRTHTAPRRSKFSKTRSWRVRASACTAVSSSESSSSKFLASRFCGRAAFAPTESRMRCGARLPGAPCWQRRCFWQHCYRFW